jgi:hypothetical protein
MPASTVHAVLNRLSHIDRATGEPVRRYEHDHPGAMIHVDVKSWGTYPMAAGGAMSDASKGARTAP